MSELINGQCRLPQESTVMRYINRIKNTGKRDYAVAYLNAILKNPDNGPWRNSPDNAPDIKDFGISYMAAQSVRLSLAAEVLKIEADLILDNGTKVYLP